MKKVMEDNGYYNAAFTVDENAIPERQQMNVTFHVTPGPQARVGKIIVEGKSGLNSEEVQRLADLHTGDRVRTQTVASALKRLRKKFQKQGRLEAQTTVLSRQYLVTPPRTSLTTRFSWTEARLSPSRRKVPRSRRGF